MSFLLKSTKKTQPADKIRIVVSLAILILFAVLMLFPIYFMFITSLGRPVEAGSANYSLWPRTVTLDSYKFFFEFSPYALRWIINSTIIAVAVTAGNVLFAGMAGYAFSKLQFRGRQLLFWMFLGTMMVPYQVIQIPLYILTVNILNMQDTYAALILPSLCTAYNIFLMKQFTSSMPTEILESAKIDGAGQPRIFVSIVVPLSKTVLAVMAITTFMDNWNTFFWPMLITTKDYMKTIQVGLAAFRFANTTYFAPMMAGACVAALPMFILFFCLQKYFLEGVTVGAVKG